MQFIHRLHYCASLLNCIMIVIGSPNRNPTDVVRQPNNGKKDGMNKEIIMHMINA